VRGWLLTARNVAGQTSSWSAHILIVVEPRVSPRDAFTRSGTAHHVRCWGSRDHVAGERCCVQTRSSVVTRGACINPYTRTINASAVSAAPETVTTVPAEGLTWLTCDRVQQESAGLRSDADEQDQR
jgi:hypothetical protein